MPSSMVRMETSKVPPPRSKMRTLHSLAPFFFVQPIGNGCSCRLVDDSENIESTDDPSILSSLALRVVKVRWNCYNSVLHITSQVSLGSLLHLG